MTRLAYFGHDIADAAIRRRVEALSADGLEVTGFMMRRSDRSETAWPNIDLGQTQDGAFVQRLRQVFRGARMAADAGGALETADVILARNVDMLACAFLAKRHLNLSTPVIYECLDVHRLLVREDPIGGAIRQLEAQLLKRCAGLIVSSQAFVRNHFEPRYGGHPATHLVENRLSAGMAYGPRPAPEEAIETVTGPLRIGWFGILRCARTLNILLETAKAYPRDVEIIIRGRVSRVEIPDFETAIQGYPNVQFGGAYKAPEDLAEIYSSVDLVWAGDFMEAGFNSVWLLPNRLYEGGYFGVPPIAPAGTETATWIARHDCGYSVAEPIEQSLVALAGELIATRDAIAHRRAALLRLPEAVFVQPRGTMRALIEGFQGVTIEAEINEVVA